MRIKHTVWQPHTCKCLIVYSWDLDSTEDDRKHTIVEGVLGSNGHMYKTTHCGGDHIPPPIGEQLEGSAFHKEYIKREAARVAALPVNG